tara:strand:- start:1589 stop:2155 length:567 start_codon:yes stop_codon:yes gene_type:complete
MSTAAVRDVLRIPGRLVINPTDITADFPHGGTEMGLTRDAEMRLGISTSLVTAEEWGQVPVEAVYAGESAVFAAVLREWDNDAISNIFPNTGTGTISGDRTILGRSSGGSVNRAGYLLSNKSFILLFSPKAIDRHPMVIVRKAVPMVNETASLSLSLAEEFGIGVVFHAIPDSSGRLYDIGKREDLTL